MSVRSSSRTGKVDIQKELRVFTGVSMFLKTHFDEVTNLLFQGRIDALAGYGKFCMVPHIY